MLLSTQGDQRGRGGDGISTANRHWPPTKQAPLTTEGRSDGVRIPDGGGARVMEPGAFGARQRPPAWCRRWS